MSPAAKNRKKRRGGWVVPKSYHPMLLALSAAKPKVRTLLLKSLDAPTIRTLAQLASNVLHGNVPLKPHQKRKLRKFKNLFSILRNKYVSIEQKRRALIQRGGFLPFLIPIVSSIAGALISRIGRK